MSNLTNKMTNLDERIARALKELQKDPEANKEQIREILAFQERLTRSRASHKIYRQQINELIY